MAAIIGGNMIFKRKKNNSCDPVEEKFSIIIDLVKDLDRSNFNRLKGAMDLGYSAYQKVRNVKTADEKEVEDILSAEKILGKDKNDN